MLSKYLRQFCTRKLIVQCLHWSHSHLFKEKWPTCLLPWSVWTFQKKLSVCAMLTHGPQTTLYRKIMYNFVWIYLCQHCTKKLPVQCWPMANRQILWEKNPIYSCTDHSGTTLHGNIVYSMLPRHVWVNIAPENYLKLGTDICFHIKTSFSYKYVCYSLLNQVGYTKMK